MPITLKKDVWKVKDPSSGQYRGAAILSTTLPQDAAQIISESNTTIQNIKDTAIDAVDTALNDESTGLIPKAEADRDAIDDSLNNASNGIIPTAQSDRDDIDDSLNNINDGIIPEAQANLATIAAAVQSQISQGTDKTLSVAKGFADAKAAGMLVKVSNYQPGSQLDDPRTSQDASQNTGYPVYKDSNRVWVKETYAELEVPTMDDVDEVKNAIGDVNTEVVDITSKYTPHDNGRYGLDIGDTWREGSNAVYKYVVIVPEFSAYQFTFRQYKNTIGSYIYGTDDNNIILQRNTPIDQGTTTGFNTVDFQVESGVTKIYVTSCDNTWSATIKAYQPTPLQNQITNQQAQIDGQQDQIDEINSDIGNVSQKYTDITNDYTVESYGGLNPVIGNQFALGTVEIYRHIAIPITTQKKYRATVRQYKNTTFSYIAGVDADNVVRYVNTPVPQGASSGNQTYDIDLPDNVSTLYVTSVNSGTDWVGVVETVTPFSLQGQIDSINNELNGANNNTPRMEFAAHQGSRILFPANTAIAYEYAGKQGFKWAWIAGMQCSSEKTFYVIHDTSLDNRTTGTGRLDESTDEYIDSVYIDYQPSGVQYTIGDFTEDQRRIPKLEEVIQICLRYNMNMCLRMNCIPSSYSSETDIALWDSFIAMVKGYHIEDAIFSGSRAQLRQLRTRVDDSWEACLFVDNNTTPEEYVTLLNEYPELANNRSCIIFMDNLTLAGCKLLHQNNIKIYAYTVEIPTAEQLENAARWGVDIFQNPYYSKMPQ